MYRESFVRVIELLRQGKTIDVLKLYVGRQATGVGRYVIEQLLCGLVGWIPTVVGIGLHALLYRLILHMNGLAAIENGVRFRFASNIRLGRNV